MERLRELILLSFLLLVTGETKKVDVKFYGESLCPDCTGFTTKTLKPIFTSGIEALIDFRYYGWGNVQKFHDKYACQHGPLECTMNTVLNCAQHESQNQNQFFEFLYCIESQVGPQVEDQIPGCASLSGIPLKSIEKCYKGEQGQKLDAAARESTDGLNPAHTYVPWVTVNGQPIFNQVDFLAYFICAAWTGENRPGACSQPLDSSNNITAS